MRKALLALAAAAVITVSVMPAATASADASPVLACGITPNYHPAYQHPSCYTNEATSAYTISYQVQGGSGAYTYTWTYPSGYTIWGCTSTSATCALEGVHATMDVDLTVSVLITQGTSSTTLSAEAVIGAVCGGSYFC